MKTAMQEMIEWLDRQRVICINSKKQHEADFLNGHISVATTLREKEKQHLIDAHNEGWLNGTEFPKKNHIQAEDYYNETFK